MSIFDTLTEKRAAARTELDAILADDAATPESETRAAALIESIRDLDARMTELTDMEARAAAVAETRSKLGYTETARETSSTAVKDAPVYGPGSKRSYFNDVIKATISQSRDALEALDRNTRMTLDEAKRQNRALSTTDGAGGDFVPPLFLIDQFVALQRPARVAADLCTIEALPSGTDQVNLPKVTTGTVVGVQSAQNAAFANTDLASSTVSGDVFTLGGIQQISVQLIEQSPINFDNVVIRDLAADYAQKLDVQVLTANTARRRGLLNVPSGIAITYTDASPAVVGSGKLWGRLTDAIQQVHSTRFAAPNAIIMHPRRWASFLAALDTTNRPLVTPGAFVPTNQSFNAVGVLDSVVPQGYVGNLQGVSVFVDPNVPVNIGAGTNQDAIIVAKMDDVYLYESTPRVEVFRETYANQGTVMVRMYNYLALISERYPSSVATINGTGLVTPTY